MFLGANPIDNGVTAAMALAGRVGGRITFNDPTTLSLAAYGAPSMVVGGQMIAIDGTQLLSTGDGVLDANGLEYATALDPSYRYPCYFSNSSATYAPLQMRLSIQAPTRVDGVYMLGAAGNALNWLFLGWVLTTALAEFEDSLTFRGICNYYNRRPRRVFVCPAYGNDNAQTTYAANLAAYGPINAGVDDSVTFIANGEDAFACSTSMQLSAATGAVCYSGPGVNSSTTPAAVAALRSTGQSATTVHVDTPAAGVVTLHLLAMTTGVGQTVVADAARNGAASDPPVTFLEGWVML